jgi:hypothetical protein
VAASTIEVCVKRDSGYGFAPAAMAAIVGANNASMHATPKTMSTAFDMTRSHKAGLEPNRSQQSTGTPQLFLELKITLAC